MLPYLRSSNKQKKINKLRAVEVSILKEKQQIRDHVVLFLLFFTSEECWDTFTKYIPSERLAYNLSHVWFSDIYMPSTRYLTSLKGDYSDERANLFRESFTAEESEALERFHRFFELRIDMLSDNSKQLMKFSENDLLSHIVKDASYLLKKLDPDFKEKQERLAQHLKRELSKNGRLYKGEGIRSLFKID